MANETIEQNNMSFGIQDTMEMGMGNQDLLNDLLSPETSTADPDKLKDINDNDNDDNDGNVDNTQKQSKKPLTENKLKGGNIEEEEEEEEEEGENLIESFLSSDDDDDDDYEGLKPAPKVTKGTPKKPSNNIGDDYDVDDTDGEKGSTQFEALANDLFELGVFQRGEEEENISIKSPEEFLERFNEEKKRGAMQMVDNFIGQFGPEYQEAFDSIFVKGLNPREYFKSANEIGRFTDMDMSIESNQEKVMRKALSKQGFEQEDIESEIERLRNYGDLEAVSQKHHKVLIKHEAAELQQKAQEAQLQQQMKAQTKQAYYDNVNKLLGEKIKEKEFDGIPLNPKIANELQDFLLIDKWKTDSGETLTDFDRYILELKRPENHATKVKIGLLIKLLEKDPTLSTIQKSGVTKKTDKLFKEVSRQVANSGNKQSSPGSASPHRWFAK